MEPREFFKKCKNPTCDREVPPAWTWCDSAECERDRVLEKQARAYEKKKANREG